MPWGFLVHIYPLGYICVQMGNGHLQGSAVLFIVSGMKIRWMDFALFPQDEEQVCLAPLRYDSSNKFSSRPVGT